MQRIVQKKKKATKFLEQAQIHADDTPFFDVESLFSLDDEYSPQTLAIMAYSISKEDSNSDSDDASDPNPIRRFLPVRGEKKQLLTQLQSIQKEVTQSERNKHIFDYGCNCCKVSPVKNALGYIYIDYVICSNTFEEVQIWF